MSMTLASFILYTSYGGELVKTDEVKCLDELILGRSVASSGSLLPQ